MTSDTSGSLERIYIRPSPGAPQQQRRQVQAVAGQGLEGDRYFGAQDEPGQNVSLVEAEAIERWQMEAGQTFDLSVTARNLVTRGVRLNDLVGREFCIGPVRLLGVELCEPCMTLGQALQTANVAPHEVVRRWLKTGGLRATVLTSGELTVGATISETAALSRTGALSRIFG